MCLLNVFHTFALVDDLKTLLAWQSKATCLQQTADTRNRFFAHYKKVPYLYLDLRHHTH